MHSVLIVNRERDFITCLRSLLDNYKEGIRVLLAKNGKQATKIIDSTSVDLVVTDYAMSETEVSEFIAYITAYFPSIPLVVINTSGSSRIKETLEAMGALAVLEKPINMSELASCIIQGLKPNPQEGTLTGISLESFMQLVEKDQKTCVLEIQLSDKKREGVLYCVRGELYDAICEDLQGEEAALEMVTWDDVKITLMDLPKQKINRHIETELMSLIMAGTVRKDEMLEEKTRQRQKLAKSESLKAPEQASPSLRLDKAEEDELMVRAVKLVEGHHFEQAQELIHRVLESNPIRLEAWQWLSNASDDIDVIYRCLGEAQKLAPTNPDIEMEIARVRALREKTKEKIEIRRCPFCWFLEEAKLFYCRSCNAYSRIEGTFLAVHKYVNKVILEDALDRYWRVLRTEDDNVAALYYSGIAHVNLKNWQKAIDFLCRAIEVSPHDASMQDQLDILLMYLAAGDPFAAKQADIDHQEIKKRIDGKTILVAESDDTIRMVISIILSRKGCRIIEAVNGMDALDFVMKNKPGVILLDTRLPGMDGHQVLEAIQNNKELIHTPVIMIASEKLPIDGTEKTLSGISGHLTKPFHPDHLLALVSRCFA